jgi:hypothetical protein
MMLRAADNFSELTLKQAPLDQLPTALILVGHATFDAIKKGAIRRAR